MSIQRDLDESIVITGGADYSPRARVIPFRTLGSLHNGDKTLLLEATTGDASIVVSLETMKEIIRWAESKA